MSTYTQKASFSQMFKLKCENYTKIQMNTSRWTKEKAKHLNFSSVDFNVKQTFTPPHPNYCGAIFALTDSSIHVLIDSNVFLFVLGFFFFSIKPLKEFPSYSEVCRVSPSYLQVLNNNTKTNFKTKQ